MQADNNLPAAVGTGAVWSTVGRVATHGLEFVVGLVFARILGPAQFGLVAMGLVVLRLADLLTDMGISAALVFRRDAEAGDWRTALLLNVTAGAVMTSATFLCAPIISAFFNRPDLAPVVRLLSPYFVLRAMTLIAQASYSKDLNLRPLALVEGVAAAVGGAFGVGAALFGLGARAVALQYLAMGLTSLTLLAKRTTGLVRSGRASLHRAQSLWEYARGLIGFSVVNYVARNADDILLGRYVGASELGFYNRAYALMLLPIGQFARVLDRVMLPSLARINEDERRLTSAYLRSVRIVALLALPLFGIAAVVAQDVVTVLLGESWAKTGPLFRILAIAGGATIISTTSGWLFQATGQTALMFRWGLLNAMLAVASFAIGLRWGASGVAAAYAIRAYLVLPTSISVPGKAIHLRFRHVLGAIMPELGLTAASVAGALGVLLVVPDAASPLTTAAGATGAGFAALGLGILLLHPLSVSELRSLVAGLVRSPATMDKGQP